MIHRGLDDKPVIIATGRHAGRKLYLVVDDITGEDDARIRHYGGLAEGDRQG